jgi:hypothetical protein
MSIYTIRQGIRQEIATVVVRQAEPGYDTWYYGEYFAVDTDNDNEFDAVMYREGNAPWNPWGDDAVAVPVAELFSSTVGFDPTLYDGTADFAFDEAVSFALSELPQEWDSE